MDSSFDYRGITPGVIAQRGDQVLAELTALLDAVASTPAPGTWDSVMGPLVELFERQKDFEGSTLFLAHVAPEEVADAARAAEERLGKWRVAQESRDDVPAAIDRYASTDEAAALPPDHRRLLDDIVHDWKIAGFGLAPEARAELTALRDRVVELEVAFARNIARHEQTIEAREDELEGVPAALVASFERRADGTVLLPLDGVVFGAVRAGARSRDLRRRVVTAWLTRAEDVNRPIVVELAAARLRMARILGYPSWAHVKMERRMVGSPDRVASFYADLVPGLTKLARAEYERLADLLEQETGDRTLTAWDLYYLHLRRNALEFGIDQERLSDHLSLENVLSGFFEVTGELFGVRYDSIPADGAWHPDVRRFRIRDAETESPLATFDLDLHPRPGKFTHAACWDLRVSRTAAEGGRVEPYAAIVANLPPPDERGVSLLRYEDAMTIFHEMGHVLHVCLTEVPLAPQAGTYVRRDFVEAPSQILQHLLRDPGVLLRFARDIRTGDTLPAETAEAIGRAAWLDAGLLALRQVTFGRLDLALHGPEPVTDLDEVNRRAWDGALVAYPEGTLEVASFGHVVGYDAGYYGYLWSEVIGDDLWSRFAEAGVMDRGVGMAYRREILARGDREPPEALVRAFLGRDFSTASYLRLRGIAD